MGTDWLGTHRGIVDRDKEILILNSINDIKTITTINFKKIKNICILDYANERKEIQYYAKKGITLKPEETKTIDIDTVNNMHTWVLILSFIYQKALKTSWKL